MSPLPIWDYGLNREAQYRDIFTDPRFAFADFLKPLFQKLPFKLGESAATTIIPYALDDQLAGQLDAALDSLVALLAKRREGQLSAPAGSALALQGEHALCPPHYSLAPFADNPFARLAAQQAMHCDPLLDAGLFNAWLTNAPGGSLLASLAALFAKNFAEDVKARGKSNFLHLAWTATLDAFESVKDRAKPHISRALPWEKLEKAIGFALFALAQAALQPILETLEEQHFNFNAASYRHALLACLSPLACCSIPRRALQDDLNPWGLSQKLAEELERLWFGLLEIDPSPQHAAGRIAHEIDAQESLRTQALQAGAIHGLRCQIFVWLDANRDADDNLLQPFIAHLKSNAALFRLLSDPKALEAALRRYAETRRIDAAAAAANAQLLACLRQGFDSVENTRSIARSFTCWSIDRATAHTLLRGRSMLRDQRRDQGGASLRADYLKGRLYRLSADRNATLSSLSVHAQGHLFVDLKGFTQRTYRAKEIDMADFLRTEFYEPILAAAAHCSGFDQGEQRLRLQNLPGDAAIFSGELPALVDLAQAIWRICREYGRKLDKRLASTTSALQIRRQEIQAQLQQQILAFDAEGRRLQEKIDAQERLAPAEKERLVQQRFEAERAALQAQAQGCDGATRQDVLKALEELTRQQRELEQICQTQHSAADRARYLSGQLNSAERLRLSEIERQIAEARQLARTRCAAIQAEERDFALEAGLFISYGSAAEIAAISSPAFGAIQVAVAEKINEAARGTARNAHLKARLDERLAQERQLRCNRELAYPFRIHIGPEFCLSMPRALCDRLERALKDRDMAIARDLAQGIAQAVLSDLARVMGQGDGRLPESIGLSNQIYNIGEALSGEALAAWLTATSPQRHWFRKVVSIESLDADLRTRFLFLSDELDLTVSLPIGGPLSEALIFRRAGQIQFRGFESKAQTTVYEMIRRDSDFGRLLVDRHLASWSSQAGMAARDRP